MKLMLNAAMIAGSPVAPASGSASASDNINRRQTRAYALDSAETNYSGNYGGMRWK
jgi:dTDP-D-glucose 4,6-dehydratase